MKIFLLYSIPFILVALMIVSAIRVVTRSPGSRAARAKNVDGKRSDEACTVSESTIQGSELSTYLGLIHAIQAKNPVITRELLVGLVDLYDHNNEEPSVSYMQTFTYDDDSSNFAQLESSNRGASEFDRSQQAVLA